MFGRWGNKNRKDLRGTLMKIARALYIVTTLAAVAIACSSGDDSGLTAGPVGGPGSLDSGNGDSRSGGDAGGSSSTGSGSSGNSDTGTGLTCSATAPACTSHSTCCSTGC